MKKIIILLATIVAFAGCAKHSDITNLQDQINNLRSDKIATLDEQITAINISIVNLEDMGKMLES